ncbi:MAG TPA: tetratricopeptide repeat protein, partial [Streptosporangiaceae bacterium]|nr:tetratricopeptide repeat protein [Streptosporangiaceae bacterium]
DALQVYHDSRAALAEQLGLDPGPDLQRLYQQILTRDPALETQLHHDGDRPGHTSGPEGVAAAAPAPGLPIGVPRQLPAATRAFVGRAGELRKLDELLDLVTGAEGSGGHRRGPGNAAVAAIGGAAGVGKTTLAVHWAHRAANRFPGGQLYVNLRGFDPSGQPAQPAEAIRAFLDALGVPPERIPAGLDTQAALYRTLLADRRVLVVLDNARDAAQVRPLLPGAPGCLVLVTSRRQLTSLAAAEGAELLTLGLLSAAEARDLLARHLSPARIAAERQAADDLTQLCARLPLALSITAARAAARPGLPLAGMASELRDSHARLDTLSTGDDTTDVRAVFSWSYDSLSVPAARMFALLGLHSGPDIPAPAAASLAGVPMDRARACLAELTHAHLLTQHHPAGMAGEDRYRLHDLLRLFAHDRLDAGEPAYTRNAAVNRVAAWYLASACAARGALDPNLPPLPAVEAQLPVPPMAFPSDVAAFAWFEAERANLSATALSAAAYGLHEIGWKLPTAMFAYFDRSRRFSDWVVTHQSAISAAQLAGDKEAEGKVRCNLGNAYRPMRRFGDAAAQYEQALELFRIVGWRQGQAKALGNLASTKSEAGDSRGAVAASLAALAIFREIGDKYGEALCLSNIGSQYLSLGQYDQARESSEAALTAFTALGDQRGAARATANLGNVFAHTSRHEQAVPLFKAAAEAFSEVRDPHEQAAVLCGLAGSYLALGRPDQAHAFVSQALDLYTSLGEDWLAADLEKKFPDLANL